MEKSGFFNAVINKDGTPDKSYLAEDFAEYFATFIGNGIFPNPASQLQVVQTDKMQVTIKQGKAWINGFIYINTNDLILDIDVADGVLNRIDKVVLRYDVSKREIRSYIKKGEFSSSPIAPTITRNADMYELGLADININAGAIKISQADITDLRLNKELCGIVKGTVEEIDTTNLFAQYNDSFKKWFNSIQGILDQDAAGHLSLQIKENKEQISKLFINVDNIKSNVRRAIIDKDNKINVPSDPSTDDLVDGIKQIKVGYATGDKISYRELKEIWYYDISIKIINGNSLNKEDLLIRIKKDYIYILNLKENTLTKINKNGHVVWTKTNITATDFDADDECIYLANNKTLTKLSVEDGHKILEKEMDREILGLGILEKYICICLINHWINIFDKNNFENAGNVGISKIGTDKIEAYFYDQYRYAILDKENKKKLEIVSPSLSNNKFYEFTEPIEWIQIEDNYPKWLYFYTKEGLYSIDRSLNLKKEISNILYNTKDIIHTANEMYYTTNNIIYYQNEIGELKEVIKLDKESDIIKIFKSEENNLLILFNNGYLKKINLNNKKYIII